MAGILNDALGIAKDVIFDVFSQDTNVQKDVTYRSPGRGDYNPTTGVNDDADTDDSIEIIRTPVNTEDVQKNEGILMGDRKYLGKVSEFTNLGADDWKEGDQIIDGSETWRVIMIRREPTSTMVMFFTRRIEG